MRNRIRSFHGPGARKGHAMKVNEGVVDRAIRVVVGVALIGLAIAGTLGPWAYIGVVPLVTGAIGLCPLYSLLGVSTCPASPRT
jgi:hypothetical protein